MLDQTYKVGDVRAFLMQERSNSALKVVWRSGGKKYDRCECWDLENWTHFTLSSPKVPEYGVHIFEVVEVGSSGDKLQYLWKLKTG